MRLLQQIKSFPLDSWKYFTEKLKPVLQFKFLTANLKLDVWTTELLLRLTYGAVGALSLPLSARRGEITSK
jgi:hypothetical protein